MGQGGVSGHRYPGAGVVIKQEQTDFSYDSGKRCSWEGDGGVSRGLLGGVACDRVDSAVKHNMSLLPILLLVHIFNPRIYHFFS